MVLGERMGEMALRCFTIKLSGKPETAAMTNKYQVSDFYEIPQYPITKQYRLHYLLFDRPVGITG